MIAYAYAYLTIKRARIFHNEYFAITNTRERKKTKT